MNRQKTINIDVDENEFYEYECWKRKKKAKAASYYLPSRDSEFILLEFMDTGEFNSKANEIITKLETENFNLKNRLEQIENILKAKKPSLWQRIRGF